MQSKSVALLLPTSSYRSDDFLAAAEALGIDVTRIANYCHRLAPGWGMPATLSVPFDQPEVALERLKAELAGRQFDAVLAVDDSGVELAAALSRHFGVDSNSAAAIRCLRDKLAFRTLQHAHGFDAPQFVHLGAGTGFPAHDFYLPFPVVVKARRLSASRGVIRADDVQELREAVRRVAAIQRQADRDADDLGMVIEEFIPGTEYAFEGMLANGQLTTLALFDKPDPLDGPFFEETLYVTPSRLSLEIQHELIEQIQAHCSAAGLVQGPVHAEARVDRERIVLLEIAPRSIGGLCGRVLRYTLGTALEELVLRNALNMPATLQHATGAAGVMMIPIPRRGLLVGVEGLMEARRIPLVQDVVITAETGHLVLPPPEGASYLGFIFARGEAPAEVEHALRAAHAQLYFQITAEYPLAAATGPS